MNDVATARGGSPVRTTPTWLVAAIAGAFGLLYAYAVWNAIAMLIDQASGRFGLNALGWGVLLSAAVFPIFVFVGAVALGRRRSASRLALLLLVGLALVAVFWLNVVAYALSPNGGSLLGG